MSIGILDSYVCTLKQPSLKMAPRGVREITEVQSAAGEMMYLEAL